VVWGPLFGRTARAAFQKQERALRTGVKYTETHKQETEEALSKN